MKKEIVAATALLILVAAGQAPRAQSAAGDFTSCSDSSADPHLAGSLCARFQAPADSSAGGKTPLFLRQFPAAAPSRGQVWLVTGGAGAALYPLIDTMRQAFPGYDLIVPDLPESPAAARVLQAEIDRYSKSGATLLYGASRGGDVVLKTLPLVKPRRVEAVILDSPAVIRGGTPGATARTETENKLTAPWPGQDAEPGTANILPRTLVLQGSTDETPPAEIEKKGPVTTYTIDGAPSFLMMTVPECAAPLVRGFVEGGTADEGAPCAGRLSIKF